MKKRNGTVALKPTTELRETAIFWLIYGPTMKEGKIEPDTLWHSIERMSFVRYLLATWLFFIWHKYLKSSFF